MKRLKFLAVFLVVLTLHQSISVCAVEITANDLKATTELHVKNDTNEKNNSNSTTSTENNSSTGKRCTIVLSDSGQWSVGSAPGERGHCPLVFNAAEEDSKQPANFTEEVRSIQHDLQRVLQKFRKLGEPVPPSVEQPLQEQLQDMRRSWLLRSNYERREAVKAMAREAWRAVKENASKVQAFRNLQAIMSIYGALSTFHLMGLKAELKEALQWLEKAPKLEETDGVVTLRDINSQFIGGLLSMFALTGGTNRSLLETASHIVKVSKWAYTTHSGLPRRELNFAREHGHPLSFLDSAGGDYLEATYLGDLTADRDQVKERAVKLRQKLVQMRVKSYKNNELYFQAVADEYYGNFHNSFDWILLNSYTSAFYRSLLTSTIQSGKRDLEGLQLYTETIDGLINIGVIQSNDSTGLGLATKRSPQRSYFDDRTDMMYSACFAGGMLSLGAKEILTKYLNVSKNLTMETVTQHQKLATQLAETCYQASTRTATKLAPVRFYPQNFSRHDGPENEENGNDDHHDDQHYLLEHEYAETNFFLWRLTGDVKYRERSWEMAQAIAKHCKVRNNGSGFKPYLNVESLDEPYIDVEKAQPAAFLSGTLKYLYLTFAPTDVLPLDKWVFNAVGHPLPICGQHPEAVYPTKYCSKKKQLFNQEESATTTERAAKSSPPPPPPPVAAQ